MLRVRLSLLVLLGLRCIPGIAATPVADLGRLETVLKDIFPGAVVTREWDMHLDSTYSVGSIEYPDALRREPVFFVTGTKATTRTGTERYTGPRLVRLKLFALPAAHSPVRLLGILQYRFLDPAISAGSSVSTAVLLEEGTPTWRVASQFTLDTMHHSTVTGIQLVDLDGDGREELLLDSQSGGAETIASVLIVFQLAQGLLQPILLNTTRLQQGSESNRQEYTQVLDIGAAIQARATQFCFAKTAYAEGVPLAKPRRTRACYARGEGLDNLPDQDELEP